MSVFFALPARPRARGPVGLRCLTEVNCVCVCMCANAGYEALTLEYNVKWPVSLVLGRHSLSLYGLMFRHLFYCKRVERQLCSTWMMDLPQTNLVRGRALLFFLSDAESLSPCVICGRRGTVLPVFGTTE